jgi:hypothetical protein
MMMTCTECGKHFPPHRERIFDHKAVTCAKPECQRKRKTRLQRERREAARQRHDAALRSNVLQDVASVRSSRVKQRRPTLPRAKGPGWGNALRQRRSSLPQPPEAS